MTDAIAEKIYKEKVTDFKQCLGSELFDQLAREASLALAESDTPDEELSLRGFIEIMTTKMESKFKRATLSSPCDSLGTPCAAR